MDPPPPRVPSERPIRKPSGDEMRSRAVFIGSAPNGPRWRPSLGREVRSIPWATAADSACAHLPATVWMNAAHASEWSAPALLAQHHTCRFQQLLPRLVTGPTPGGVQRPHGLAVRARISSLVRLADFATCSLIANPSSLSRRLARRSMRAEPQRTARGPGSAPTQPAGGRRVKPDAFKTAGAPSGIGLRGAGAATSLGRCRAPYPPP